MARGPDTARPAKSSGLRHINKLLQEYGPPFLIDFQTVVLPLFEKYLWYY